MNKRGQTPHLPATQIGPRPADFPLGSVESRAAVRAQIRKLAEQDAPRPGFDVLFQLEEVGWPQRHRSLLEILDGRGVNARPKRVGGRPVIWLALPPGFRPESIHAGTCPNDLRDGAVAVLPISLTDIPFIKKFLTIKELATLCGRPEWIAADAADDPHYLECWRPPVPENTAK